MLSEHKANKLVVTHDLDFITGWSLSNINHSSFGEGFTINYQNYLKWQKSLRLIKNPKMKSLLRMFSILTIFLTLRLKWANHRPRKQKTVICQMKPTHNTRWIQAGLKSLLFHTSIWWSLNSKRDSSRMSKILRSIKTSMENFPKKFKSLKFPKERRK